MEFPSPLAGEGRKGEGEDTAAYPTPWLEWRGIGMGLLGWSPETFWQATPQDLTAAVMGRALLASGLSTDSLAQLHHLLERTQHEL